jgi:hypothetical protein
MPTVEPFLIAVAAVALLSIIKLLLPIVFTLLVTSRVMLTLLLLVIFDDDDDDDDDRISLSITLEFVSLVVVVIFVVVDVLFGVGFTLLSLVFVVVVFVFIYTIPNGTELSFVLLDVSDIDVIGDALFLVIRTDVGICEG